MNARDTRAYCDAWGKPPRRKRKTRPTHIVVRTCPRCLGAKSVLFQWFGQQTCPQCNGSGEIDE